MALRTAFCQPPLPLLRPKSLLSGPVYSTRPPRSPIAARSSPTPRPSRGAGPARRRDPPSLSPSNGGRPRPPRSRTLQPRPEAPRSFDNVVPAVDALPPSALLPKLVVFDLDHTLWTPELYTLSSRFPEPRDKFDSGSRSRRDISSMGREDGGGVPRAWKDVWLLDGAQDVLWELATAPRWAGVGVAAASRTSKGDWARSLLREFAVPGLDEEPGATLDRLFSHKEIYTGSKVMHFERLRERTGVEYRDMIFFDDARSGKYGNCDPVSRMGVLAVHCPDGLSVELWGHALEEYARLRGDESRDGHVGTVLSLEDRDARSDPFARPLQPQQESSKSEPSVTPEISAGQELDATVVQWKSDRKFGFVRAEGTSQNVFFHVRNCTASGYFDPRVGDRVRVGLVEDTPEANLAENNHPHPGRLRCAWIRPNARKEGPSSKHETRRMPCFSMNQPFAALLANGVKTIESRTYSLLSEYAGQTVVLHVGRRTFPDHGKYISILKETKGMTESEVAAAAALPFGMHRGHAVAVLRLGKTRFVPDSRVRSKPEIEGAVCANGLEMGSHLTEVKAAAWLKESILVKVQRGVFEVEIPSDVIPDDF